MFIYMCISEIYVIRDLSEFKCLLFGSDTLWCTESGREVCGVRRSPEESGVAISRSLRGQFVGLLKP